MSKPIWDSNDNYEYQKNVHRLLSDLVTNYSDNEFIPIMCEMFSKVMVETAEKSFDVKKPNAVKVTSKKYPKEYRDALSHHNKVFKEWRKAKRPSDISHPAKSAVLESRRILQRLRRLIDSKNSIKINDDLMNTYMKDRNSIYSKVSKIRGNNKSSVSPPFIETLAG